MIRSKKQLIIIVIIALLFFMGWSSAAKAALDLPQPSGYVNDFAGMLSQQTRSSLEDKLKSYEARTGNEIAVVTVPNLQGTTVEDFAVRLFEKWEIGKKGQDNGVLFLVAKNERKIRIEVGYGLEPELTDAQAYDIVTNIVSPRFKAGQFDEGFVSGVDAIIGVLSANGAVTGSGGTDENPVHVPARDLGWLMYLGIFLVLSAFQWLVAVLGRTKSWWLGGVLGAIVGLLVMVFSVVIGVILVAILTPLGLLFDFIVSRAYEEHKRRQREGREDSHIPWWAGGGWGPGGGFGGGSSGGFGGFGGGRSGGGGASGGW
ncbi:MAG: TPM domain-containing protein [Firmicutes bacterium]|nr:TPM domain-containing protein [Bacillota bacterium]